jgi:hypothetical protein
MSDLVGQQRLRRSLLGYRRGDVDVALAELRLTVRHSESDLAAARDSVAALEHDLRDARIELDGRRAREAEIEQAFQAAQERVREIEQAAQARASAIVAEAQEQAAKTRSEAYSSKETIGAQVEELLALRDSLVQSLRGVIRDFDFAVERVERGDSVFAAETAVEEVEAAPRGDGAQAKSQGRDYGAEDGQLFDGQIELEAGPFPDFASLSAFERALGRLPKVEDVYVRRLTGERALIELSLAEPLALVEAMRDFLPYELEIGQAERGRLALTLYAASAATS